jgi:hypothetical protein
LLAFGGTLGVGAGFVAFGGRSLRFSGGWFTFGRVFGSGFGAGRLAFGARLGSLFGWGV